MAAPSRMHKRLGSHSQSTPNFATLKEEEDVWTTRQTPPLRKQPPTFTAGAASEPVSEDDESTHSASSFEREYFSRNASGDSHSGSSEDEDPEYERSSTERRSHPRLFGPGLDGAGSMQQSRPLLSHTARSQSYLGPSAFAPPFYGRPPTPLPPSPSLTSLLRPRPFTLASRPTTPDSSDTEATTNPQPSSAGFSTTTLSAAAVAQSALTATTVPRASPKVPTYEYYGFVLYLGSSMAFFLYLLWSYLPTPFLHQLGIYYYPDRWWSLAVPAWLVVVVCYIYIALASWNTGVLTLDLGDLECMVDEKGRVAVIDAYGRIVRKEKRLGEGHVRSGRQQKKGQNGGGRGKHGRSRDGGYGRAGIGVKAAKGEELRQLDWRNLWNEGTDAVMDIPIGGVCEVLYGSGRDEDEITNGNAHG